MQPNVWYKASDLMNVLGVKETRTKELLRALLADEKLVDDCKTFFSMIFSQSANPYILTIPPAYIVKTNYAGVIYEGLY